MKSVSRNRYRRLLLALVVLIASGALSSAMACGKYGGPQRISQDPPASAIDAPAPDRADTPDDEDGERKGVKP